MPPHGGQPAVPTSWSGRGHLRRPAGGLRGPLRGRRDDEVGGPGCVGAVACRSALVRWSVGHGITSARVVPGREGSAVNGPLSRCLGHRGALCARAVGGAPLSGAHNVVARGRSSDSGAPAPEAVAVQRPQYAARPPPVRSTVREGRRAPLEGRGRRGQAAAPDDSAGAAPGPANRATAATDGAGAPREPLQAERAAPGPAAPPAAPAPTSGPDPGAA